MKKCGICGGKHRVSFNDLSVDDQNQLIHEVAKQGGLEALKAVGLDGPGAVKDIQDLRLLIRSYRIVRNNVGTTIVESFGKILGWMIVIIILIFFVGHTELGKTIAKLITG